MDILLDFDGTCVSHEFPMIGKDIGAQEILKRLVKKGHNLILFTMRCDHPKDFKLKGSKNIHAKTGNYLSDAVNWFKENDIPLYGIQKNPTQQNWTTSPKAYGHIMIDDSALGCPMKFDKTVSNKPFVDWDEIKRFLILNKMI